MFLLSHDDVQASFWTASMPAWMTTFAGTCRNMGNAQPPDDMREILCSLSLSFDQVTVS